MQNNVLSHNGEVFYLKNFFDLDESDLLYKKLLNEIEWKQEPIYIYGKMVMQPRLTAWYGDSGKDILYSGISMQPQPWNSTLLDIKKRIEKILQLQFTSALLNLYRDGNDSLGWHRDNEKELGINPTIASISFGSSRTFFLRNYKNKKEKYAIELEHGSVLLMKKDTQHFWEHSIPKRKKVSKPRINITFRIMR
jgi:alkylated DNA repair dioxygenase AlkB